MNIAIILAGGIGSRVGMGVPKQFIEVQGRSILSYTIEAFQKHELIDVIEVVCVSSHISLLQDIVNRESFTKVRWIVEGGKDFQHSVMNGINNLENLADEDDILLVHYGASPFISREIITDAVKVCKEKGNCVSATPCYLLYGSNDDGKKSTQWVDRDRIMQLNSPQCFTYGYVRQLYAEATEKGILDRVEPHTTSLMYALGRDIYFSYGNQTNIKITTKEDLDLFEGYVLRKKMYHCP